MMELMKIAAITLLACMLCVGCTGVSMREQDEAMLFYRECMTRMESWGMGRSSEALSNPATRQSVTSVMKSDAQAFRQLDCAQYATWRPN